MVEVWVVWVRSGCMVEVWAMWVSCEGGTTAWWRCGLWVVWVSYERGQAT